MSGLLTSPTVPEDASLSRAVLARGVFYYPAGLHYGNPDAAVTCDRCRRTNIVASVGFERYDYCLPCVEAVAHAQPVGSWRPDGDVRRQEVIVQPPRNRTESPYMTLMAQEMFTTAMVQDIFSARAPATRMMDSMYRRNLGSGR